MLHELFTNLIKSFSRTIGRILAYISIALVIFLIYDKVNALEIDSNNMPIDSEYVDLFGRILESKPIDTNYMAFSHNCGTGTCYTLLTGNIEKKKTATVETITVEELPNSSRDTLDKVYKFNDKYYVTKENTSNYTPIPLNEDLKSKIIYIDYKSITYEYINDLITSKRLKEGSNFVEFNKNFNDIYNKVKFTFWKNNVSSNNVNHYSLQVPHLNNVSDNQIIIFLEDGTYQREYDSFVSNFSFSITSWLIPEMEKYFSLTPFETTYSWEEITLDTFSTYHCVSCEYITYSNNEYTKGVYTNLEIKGDILYSNLTHINLERGTNYDKVQTFLIAIFISFMLVGLLSATFR